MVGRVVDAADEGDPAVYDQQLAMHAPEQVQADAQGMRSRVVAAHDHPGLGQRGEEVAGESRRAVTIDQDRDPYAAPGRLHQARVQRVPALVLEQDEGLQQDLAACRLDRLERARIEALAVLQQPYPVPFAPVSFDAHAATSPESRACSGRWSDSRVHGAPRG